METLFRFIILLSFSAWSDSCKSAFQQCKTNSDCCKDYYCKDVRNVGNGHCVLNPTHCPPLRSKKLQLECTTLLNRNVTCDQPLPLSTRATFRCNAPIYYQKKKPEYTEIRCRNGQWNRPLLDDFCEVDCGRSTSDVSKVTKTGEQKSEVGEFPWHAGVYEFNRFTGEYYQKCGGTLISLKVVISAAHCFATENSVTKKIEIRDLSIFKVAVGKYYRSINATEQLAQIRDVARVDIPREYKGLSTHFEGDIAFVILKEDIKYSRAVLPVCIDVGKDHFEDNSSMQSTMGKIANWDLKNEGMYNEKLMVTNIPFISKDRCLKKLGHDWFYYINYQKICAGDEKTRYNVCEGNGGAGLVFADPDTKKYYLRGVVSLTPKCSWEDGIAVFTTLSSYKKAVKRYSSDNCETLTSNKLLLECFTPSNQTIFCNKSLETNSRAKFRCKSPVYFKIREPEYTEITCLNGQWDRPLIDDFCEAECGKPFSNATLRSNRTPSITDLPWHAGIYELKPLSEDWEQICGGTIISPKVIITAAFCFEKNRRKSDPIKISVLKVAVGKSYRDMTAREDNFHQIKDVASVRLSPDNERNPFKGDIAFVILKESIEYSRDVLPICIDVGANSFENDQLVNGAIGMIAGWGHTEHGILSERLMVTEMELVPTKECRDKSRWRSYVNEEKICARGRKLHYNVCEPYTGGGLVFEELVEEKYYLRGILGAGPCQENDKVAFFTALSSYAEMIERYKEGKCEPLVSAKLEIMCFTPSKEMTSCNKPLEKNSRATFRCKRPTYWEISEPEYTEITCRNGQWDLPLVDDFCERDCGRFISKWERPTFGNKHKIENTEFPWHVWIYEFDSKRHEYEQQCGGTLISSKIVVSAADCYVRQTSREQKIDLKDLSTFKVAVGKFHRTINTSLDEFAQIKNIAEVAIPPEYHDKKSDYIGNVAIVTLREKVEYTWAVQPICIDFGDDTFENEQLVEGATGKFVGLRIHRGHAPSKTLQLVETPFIPTEKCKTKIEHKWHHLAKNDIFCVGREDIKTHFCDGDRGGGLVFLEPNTKKYYLRGVASLSPPCSEKNIGLFTNVSMYNEFLERFDIPGKLSNRPTRMGINETESQENKDCLGINKIGCLASGCCKNLKCVEGPNGNWEQGQCVEKDSTNLPISFPNYSGVDSDNNNSNNYNYRNYCEPLFSDKLTISCFSPSDKRISCQKNLTIDSSATFHCKKPMYLENKKPEYTEINCRNGEWDRPLLDDFCEANCGKFMLNAPVPLIISGKISEPGAFPWHAGIYKQLSNKIGVYEQICGGTLISPKVVITAAHCVATYSEVEREVLKKDLSKFKVTLGNNHRSFNYSEDKGSIQIRDINKIEVSERYRGIISRYAGDIAFLVLKEKVEYSQYVLPICIDVGEDTFEKDQVVKGVNGLVAGWGITSLQGKSSERLKFTELPFVPPKECEKKVKDEWLQYLDKDKFCVGMQYSDMNVCSGDSGGGIIFAEPESRKYYLRGVVSLGPHCGLVDGFALFTNLSVHGQLVEKYLRLP